MKQIIKKYIQQKYDDGIISPRSYEREKETFEQIKKTCSNFIYLPVQKVVAEDIEKAKAEIRNYSNSVIEKIWRLLKKGFKIAHSRRKILFNIMDDDILVVPISKNPIK